MWQYLHYLTYPNTFNPNSESAYAAHQSSSLAEREKEKKIPQQLAIMCKNDYHGDYEHMYEYVYELEIFASRPGPLGSSPTESKPNERGVAKSQTKTDRPLTCHPIPFHRPSHPCQGSASAVRREDAAS